VVPCLVLLAALGCDESQPEPPARVPRPRVVSVGQPVPPESIRIPAPGTIEVRAAEGWFAALLDPPPGREREVCVTFGTHDRGLAEADTLCDIAASDSATVVISPLTEATVVTGSAPPGVRSVRLSGPGGTHTLPLSGRRAFLAVYGPHARGRVRVVSELARGATVRSFVLPLPPRWALRPHHAHRRPGAVFNDEVGKDVTLMTYHELVGRFGAPAAVRREQGLRCVYYELVGFSRDGWRFCFAANGQMESAAGRRPLPRR
jgi:hypothetical protein